MDEMPTSTIDINKKNGCQIEIQPLKVLPPLSTFLKSQSSTKSVDRHPPKCPFSSIQRRSETDLVTKPISGTQNVVHTPKECMYRSGYDNLAVGHFMPQQLKSVCSTQSVHKTTTRQQPNTKCYQAMHLDILPSPVDSINSPTAHQPSDSTSPCPELSPDPNYVTSSLDKEPYNDHQVIADATMFCGTQDPFCTCQDDVLSNLLSTDHLYSNCMDQIPSTYLDVLHPNDLSSIFLSPQSSAVTTPPSDFLPSPPPNKPCEETHPIKQETTWTVLPPLGDFLENNSSVQIGPQFPVSCSDLSSCTSTFASPRHSYSSRGSRNKRSLSISPLSAEGLDLNTIIRMSPTSLVAYLGGSRSSSSSMSPAGDKTGCYGHLSARNSSSSPQSGYSVPRLSVSSYTPHNHPLGVRNDCVDLENNLAVYQTMGVLESNCLLAEDIAANNQLVMPQGAVQYLENPHNTKSEPFSESCLFPADASSTLPPPGPVPARPPPSYDQHMARKLKFQKKSSSDSSQSQPSSFSSFESSEGERVTDGTDTEQGKPYYICRWADCTCTTFQEQDELVKHLEKNHVDQRKGEEFACFWQGCPRRYRPFNARYKLLIHMRVHSGEKPNKCTFEGCTKAFSRLENLKIHLRSHTGERPYVCQYTGCAKAFSNSSDRAKHQRTHQDTKPYACQIPGCTKRYTDPSSLRKHVKNHSAKNDPARKKPRSSAGELDPELLNECLTIQPIPIMQQCEGSPVDNVDSCLSRSQPVSTQHQIGMASNRIHPSFPNHDGNVLLDGRNEQLNQMRCRRVPILPPIVPNENSRSRSLGLPCPYGSGGHPHDIMNSGSLRKPQISPRNFAVPNFSPNYKHENDYHDNVVSLPSLEDVTSSLSSFDTLSHFGGVS